MKRIIFSLLSVVMLVMMMLPAGIPVVMVGGNNQTATNETIESPLVADFDFDIPDCPLCKGVMFVDKSSGGVKPYTYYWDFGDGSNSTRQNPRHRYTSAGNYTVTLTVTDRADNVASKTKTVTLAPKEITVEPLSSSNLTKGVVLSWPRCNSGCQAGDAQTVDAWLVADSDCTPGQNNTAELWITFNITRDKGPYCAVAVMDIYVDGVLTYDEYTVAIDDLQGKGKWNYKIGDISWPCGAELEIRDIYVQWMVSEETCDGDCKDYPPSKCWIGGPLYVRAPLIADFEFDNICF